MKTHIIKLLREGLSNLQCPELKITQAMVDEVNRFQTDEQFLRAGGLSNETLERAAFGFAESDITTLMPKQLKVKWKDDYENVKWEVARAMQKGISKLKWAKSINLEEPIDVVYEKDNFYIDDGHHRTFAAKILNHPLNVNLEIKMNPMLKLSNLSYDDYHRCLFKQIKNS